MTWLRTLTAAILLGATAIVPATAQAPAAFTEPASLNADLARIDATLNATQTFYGRFTQLDANGVEQSGQVYIQRPGKVRFEYDGPLLIVSDGVTIAQQDKVLETVDRGPLSATPLDFFLKNNVNLARDTEIVAFRKFPTEWHVSARDGSGNVDGVLTLIFEATTLAMKGWIVDDPFGNRTQVNLSDLRYNAELDPALFVLRTDDRRDNRRR